uniref:Uncharacterized protein n=1 Tax=viral metagenome TaxID=1070528 RepID=A0A6C0JXQ9_9ZZZZ
MCSFYDNSDYNYYYLHNKLFEVAMIIHDSVFINTYILWDQIKMKQK